MFPVQIGNEADVRLYAESLTKGERQLLITEEGNMFITNGDGTFNETNGNNAKNKIAQISSKIEKLEEKINESSSDISQEISGIKESLDEAGRLISDLDVAIDNLSDTINNLIIPGNKVTVSINENGVSKIVTVQEAIDKIFSGSFVPDVPPTPDKKEPICGSFKAGQVKCGSAQKKHPVCGSFKAGQMKCGNNR